MSTATEERTIVTIPAFAIEADHPRNSDLLLQGVVGVRLRSRIDGSKPVTDARTGDQRIPIGQSQFLASFPKVPGMQIHVNPTKLTCVITDPLHGDKELCKKIWKFMKEKSLVISDSEIDGVPPRDETLDQNQMKTLCRELVNLVDAGEAKRCKGLMPKMQDVEEMPGEFLLNPGSRVPNSQPMYEKDLNAWVDKLNSTGG